MQLRSTKMAAIGAAALLAVGVTGVVLAQDPGTEAPAESRAHGPGRAVRAVIAVRNMIEASGLDASLFREGFRNGQSINDVLAANGGDSATVEAQALAELETKLAERVAAGDLDQARADEILANARERLANLMAHVPDGDHRGVFPRVRLGLGILESAAETIGITAADLAREVRETDGTIASVAEAHGVDPQVVIDAAVAKGSSRIDEAVANGRITAERGEEMTANLAGRVTRFVNENPPRRD